MYVLDNGRKGYNTDSTMERKCNGVDYRIRLCSFSSVTFGKYWSLQHSASLLEPTQETLYLERALALKEHCTLK